ncbi:MAG: non-canonical purine NTP pyrophosphatase [Desulfitibacter sp. BRH_c19]|nr:MAG: non-canonical purine NTP pyrophosphatase [Desulfitibacter sp. BRH_c19]
MKIVLATQNKGKIKEFIAMLNYNSLNIDMKSLVDIANVPEIIEDGKTFRENAFIKAKAVSLHTKLITLADDSGLEVDYLGGAPGIHSARFAGEPKDDNKNNEKLLSLLKDVPYEKRLARFRCSICIMTPDEVFFETDGTCEGIIIDDLKGEHGFGYDPLFYLPEYKKTLAQLEPDIKNTISHRSEAFKKAVKILADILQK